MNQMNQYKALLDTFVQLVREALGDQVVSIVLYGSVARRTARPDSDVDLLVILDHPSPQYWKRLRPFLPILRGLRTDPCWKKLKEQGFTPSLGLLVLSLPEARVNRYLYLDMVEEAQILVDQRDFFRHKLEIIRQRIHELGARKIKHNGDWYWDLKPDLKPGETIVL